MKAAENGHTAIAQALIAASADIEVKDDVSEPSEMSCTLVQCE